MPHRLPALLPLLVLLGLGLLAAPGHGEELDAAAWRKASKDARRLMKEPGKRYGKLDAIAELSRDDSARAAQLMVQWTGRSLKLQRGPIAKELAKRKTKLDKLEKILLKAYDKLPPTRAEDKNNWKLLKDAYEETLEESQTEDGVRYALGEGLRALRDPDAITYLLEDGLPAVQKGKGTEPVQVAIVKGLAEQPKARVLATMQALAADSKRVKLRMIALHWFAQHKHAEGFDAVLRALTAKEVAVRRIAVHGMQQFDDKRAVKALIDSMGSADGLLRAEIDDVLHWYTGKSFEGSASVWKQWWQKEGAAWLADETTQRHQRKKEALPGGTKVRFYGIPTESKHVVFVLDRSGSMEKPAGSKSIAKKNEKPKGPITGDGEGKGKKRGGHDAIAGETRMEVAKNQLALSVEELDRKVKFGLIFYSDQVKVWKQPPELLEATRSNKKAAVSWFEKLGPSGPTLMFPALMRALDYADTVGEDTKKPTTGANTIFLLSDGSPTTKDAKILAGDELEAAIETFLEANKLHRCVVHTIGIGPNHNSRILRRLAAATGGEYRAVGAK